MVVGILLRTFIIQCTLAFMSLGKNSPTCIILHIVELAATNPVMLPYTQWLYSILLPFRYFGHTAISFGITGHKNLVVHLVQGREDSCFFYGSSAGMHSGICSKFHIFGTKVTSCSNSSTRRWFTKQRGCLGRQACHTLLLPAKWLYSSDYLSWEKAPPLKMNTMVV